VNKKVTKDEPWLGRFLDTYSIPESGSGICEVIGKGYYAVIWRDHYGPYPTRELAGAVFCNEFRRNIDAFSQEDPLGCFKGIAAVLIIYTVVAALCGLGYLVWESFQ
jgi:hypothetical protein